MLFEMAYKDVLVNLSFSLSALSHVLCTGTALRQTKSGSIEIAKQFSEPFTSSSDMCFSFPVFFRVLILHSASLLCCHGLYVQRCKNDG